MGRVDGALSRDAARRLQALRHDHRGKLVELDPDDLRPYVETALDMFGVERVMYGSDWPVCLLAGSYLAVKQALEEALPALTLG